MENKKQSFKEVFSDMKDLFKDIFKDEIANQKFTDYKAKDGSILRTDTEEIAVGSKLQVTMLASQFTTHHLVEM